MKLISRLLIAVLSVCFPVICFSSCDQIMGDANCVIANNYSSIRLYDDEYLPLDLKDLNYNYGDILIEESQVEGKDFLTKLMFGDMVYEVKGCYDNDLIILSTEYDFAPSDVYCRKERLDDYQTAIDGFEEKELMYETISDDWEYTDRPLNKELEQLLVSDGLERNDKNLECTREGRSEFIDVKAFGYDKIFYKYCGCFLYQNGKYYWNDNSDTTYIIPNKYDLIMSEYFSYMFK